MYVYTYVYTTEYDHERVCVCVCSCTLCTMTSLQRSYIYTCIYEYVYTNEYDHVCICVAEHSALCRAVVRVHFLWNWTINYYDTYMYVLHMYIYVYNSIWLCMCACGQIQCILTSDLLTPSSPEMRRVWYMCIRIYMMTEPSRDSPYGTPCSPELNTLWHICTRIYILYVCVHVDKYSVFWRAISGLPVLRNCTEYDTYIHVYIYHMYSCMWINTLYFEEPSRDSLFSGIVQSVTQMCMYICHVYVQ